MAKKLRKAVAQVWAVHHPNGIPTVRRPKLISVAQANEEIRELRLVSNLHKYSKYRVATASSGKVPINPSKIPQAQWEALFEKHGKAVRKNRFPKSFEKRAQ